MDELKDFKRGGRGGDNRYGKRGVHVQYTFKGLRRGGEGGIMKLILEMDHVSVKSVSTSEIK